MSSRKSAGVLTLVVALIALALTWRSEPQGATTVVYSIRPGTGIGPVALGMSRQEARRAMEATGNSVDSLARFQGEPPVLAMADNAFQVHFDRSDRATAVEVLGPSTDGQSLGEEPPFVALYRDIDVFRTPASTVAEAVSRGGAPDPQAEDRGISFEFPTLGITLWRQDDDTPRFETVTVFRPRRR